MVEPRSRHQQTLFHTVCSALSRWPKASQQPSKDHCQAAFSKREKGGRANKSQLSKFWCESPRKRHSISTCLKSSLRTRSDCALAVSPAANLFQPSGFFLPGLSFALRPLSVRWIALIHGGRCSGSKHRAMVNPSPKTCRSQPRTSLPRRDSCAASALPRAHRRC